MKVTFITPKKTSWECDIIPNFLILRTGNEIRIAISILFLEIVFSFKIIKVTRFIAPCGTVVDKIPTVVEVPEGKEMAKFNPQTGKCYWPSDGYYAEGPGIRDIPNKTK